MELSETDDGGVAVEWWSEADVFGRIAQMGQRVINPVANRVVKRFFNDIQSQLQELEMGDDGAGSSEAPGSASTGGKPTGTSKSKPSGGILARIKRLLGLGG
jgi:hypothetical protein